MSLRTKYIIVSTGILMMVTGVFSFYLQRLDEERIVEEAGEKAAITTEIVKNGLNTMMVEAKGRGVNDFIMSSAAGEVNFVRVISTDGRVINSSNPEDAGKRYGVNMKPGSNGPVSQFSLGGPKPYYRVRVPIFNEKRCMPCHKEGGGVIGYLDVELSMEKTVKHIKESRFRSLVFYFTTLAVLSLALGILTRFLITKPVLGMMETVRMVEAGNIKSRFEVRGRDEIGMLSQRLNSMLSEIDRMRVELETCHLESIQKVEKMASIGELASAIAHEIKNPLAGISGAIQVFAEDFSPEDPRREIIAEILSEIERLDKAVRDLLSFAKPPEPTLIRAGIEPVIERTKRLITQQAEKAGVEIRTISTGDVGEIDIDPEQMQQVFLNIMLNAINSMPGGGTLTITTILKPENGEVEVSVSDTGHGIQPEDLKNIFKPFFTTRHTGTGLGLAISKNIVEKHGGRITVESRLGVGSTFRITVPRRLNDHGRG